jgi:hypothetical protein
MVCVGGLADRVNSIRQTNTSHSIRHLDEKFGHEKSPSEEGLSWLA